MSEKPTDAGQGPDGPDLELPSLNLGFRRKKKKRGAPPEEPATAAAPSPRPTASADEPVRPAADEAALADEPAGADDAAAVADVPAAETRPVTEAPPDEAPAAPAPPATPPATREAPRATPTEPPARAPGTGGPEEESAPEPDQESTAVLAPPTGTSAAAPAAAGATAARSDGVDGADGADERTSARVGEVDQTRVEEKSAAQQERRRTKEGKRAAREERRAGMADKMPRLSGKIAALATGALVGLLAVLLAWLAAQGCEVVRGVGTCGGFGLVALIAILGIEVLAGAALLRLWGVADPTSTAFLGVGTVAVVAMVFFLDQIESSWMLLVIPLLTALSFLASWWVTEILIAEEQSTL